MSESDTIIAYNAPIHTPMEKYGFEQFHTMTFQVPPARLEKFERALEMAEKGGLITGWNVEGDRIDVAFTQTRFASHKPLFGQASVYPLQFERLKRYVAAADRTAVIEPRIPVLQGFDTASLSDQTLTDMLAMMDVGPHRSPNGAGFSAKPRQTGTAGQQV